MALQEIGSAVTTARDDRVLPETRALGVFIVPFLLVAFPLLYLFPNATGNWWHGRSVRR